MSSQIPLPVSFIPTSTAQHSLSSFQRFSRTESFQIGQTLHKQGNIQNNTPSTSTIQVSITTHCEVTKIPYGSAFIETRYITKKVWRLHGPLDWLPLKTGHQKKLLKGNTFSKQLTLTQKQREPFKTDLAIPLWLH